jgi:redox-sensitive bicupin YhaK (pirin superfamily)
MITIRQSEARGKANLGWLDSKHTFSFGSYYDPQYTGFGKLLVINEDKIAPSQGFSTHGHQDMEIITYVIDGKLEHQDSVGNREIIAQGEVQRMTAGRGIRHSEYNYSADDIVHLLQIWILPAEKNLEPSYEQKFFARKEKQGKLCLLASSEGRNNSLKIHQQVDLLASIINPGQSLAYELNPDNLAWIQVVKGQLLLNNLSLSAGDGAAIQEEHQLTLHALQDDTEFLLFDFNF